MINLQRKTLKELAAYDSFTTHQIFTHPKYGFQCVYIAESKKEQAGVFALKSFDFKWLPPHHIRIPEDIIIKDLLEHVDDYTLKNPDTGENYLCSKYIDLVNYRSAIHYHKDKTVWFKFSGENPTQEDRNEVANLWDLSKFKLQQCTLAYQKSGIDLVFLNDSIKITDSDTILYEYADVSEFDSMIKQMKTILGIGF